MRVRYFGVGTSSWVLALGCFVICGHLDQFALEVEQEASLAASEVTIVGFTDGGL